MSSSNDSKQLAFVILGLVSSMLLLSFAAVPIYNIFCKATGFGGTTQRAEVFHVAKGKKKLKIEFDANIDKKLPWVFKPKHRSVSVITGENVMIFYESENISDNDIIGTAVYNVTPDKAGQYFVKIHCFCFEEQLLKSHQKMLMPVSFYIDPALEEDEDLLDTDTITLSYSFFKVRDVINN
ncbi:cytochrome c oxidase assembly protein [Rickettsia endosymbiont of Cardiosporidium cionae]|uniref:cytochrome c oxidase assembly protein n=1 Tax=Rickettsia endosymbiont of Cardiosporidium cionae TaxID=2777155 RepID=UPI001895F189|nr:cytochrome c oxidase assembly protein [Rickettsia endosymbiont of Cardiosporidium cionae]KAF8818417.1 cytochrome c oxidase assembly protein [Rickettsia endosymbiont of Cardiosporidium cionae]